MSKQERAEVGFDFGIKPNYMIVGDIEFAELFKQADCLGIVYIFEEVNKQLRPVQIVFQFKHKEPADKVMSIFMDWVSRSNDDGDAVDITFIEKKDRTYAVGISPEINKLMERVIPKDLLKRVNPLFCVITHFKQMSKQSDNYFNFKKNIKDVDEVSVGYVVGDPNQRENWGTKFFAKKRFNFVKEGEIPQDSNAIAYGMKNAKLDRKKALSKNSIEQISERRISEMKTLLPITFHKLTNLWLSDLLQELTKSHDDNIIKQAICNLTVEERMKQNFSSDSSFSISQIERLQYLILTHESFNSYYPDDDFYTIERVRNQIVNDQKVLKDYLKY